jgi:hypothetical protein
MNRAPANILALALFVMAAWVLPGCQGSSDDSSSQLQDQIAQKNDESQEPNESGPAPKIELTETSYDFGTAPEKTSVSHTFKVKNVGDAPLQLIKAKAG